jgi:hypothetical protein
MSVTHKKRCIIVGIEVCLGSCGSALIPQREGTCVPFLQCGQADVGLEIKTFLLLVWG